jgi:two-component sensor histidine kinase
MASVTSKHVEAASTLAVVAASNEPLLFLTSDLRVIAASASFCRSFQVDPAGLPGRRISDVGAGEWGIPRLISLLKAAASGTDQIGAYELDVLSPDGATHSLLLNARRLDDGNVDNVRLLLAITDVTTAREEARQKEDLIRERAILLQEIQHRVANSLQIIASVLMQSARKVQSEEARGHLRDAHNRVMSIAAVQRHLAMASVGPVKVAPYLIQLCESLGASMIQDPARLAITVAVDDSVVDANVSVSIGLIVTELVINALKHAFPGDRSGTIRVVFHSSDRNWELSVADDGVGMAAEPQIAKPGLGTGIVDALSKQLGCAVCLRRAEPGTVVTIIHDADAPVTQRPAA